MQLLKTLLAKGPADRAQKTAALLAAVEAGSFDAVGILLVAGADPAGRDARGRGAPGIALQAGDARILALLLAAGVDAGSNGNSGAPLLVEATRARDVGSVEVLLQRGAAINAVDANGESSLMISAVLIGAFRVSS